LIYFYLKLFFELFFNFYQSTAAATVHDVATHLSGQQPEKLYEHLFLHTHAGKNIFPNLRNATRASRILTNLKAMHTTVGIKHKSNILSLVVDLFTRKELKQAGFTFSNTQYTTAKKKASQENFSLCDYQRHRPLSKAATSTEVKALVIKYLYNNSRDSCATIVDSSLANEATTSMEYSSSAVYYLEIPKRDIYKKLQADYPDLKLCLSKFYKLCPKNFKKAHKKTDMCQVCIAGKKAERKLQLLLSRANYTIANRKQLEDAVHLYQQHIFFKNRQQQCYKNSINRTTSSSCVVIMDFKENLKIGGGPVETGANFYHKKQVSVLGFAVHYQDNTGTACIRYFDYLSPILSHDSLFIIGCIRKFLAHSFMADFSQVCFWSDSGPHFRSGELMHFIFEQLPQLYDKQFYMNYFVEYHGKNIVDGHFGVLSRWFKEAEAVQDIHTIEDLLRVFQNKAQAQQYHNKTSYLSTEFDLYLRPEARTHIHKLRVENFGSYLCFIRVGNKLFASTLSTLNSIDYAKVSFKIQKVKDNRKTKYAPEYQVIDIDVPIVVGPQSKVTLLNRVKLTHADTLAMKI